ncbi:hypothetical protein [Burkholderia cepacia]|uniref:hypothetical protein n=1 Tax=Burkholderia cepacia TaxID=292 RepID=UPI001CF17DA0|nr:hypothetical protein [Burkholderia cepacia]MCA8331656.1 hypothetical protein [Burkholderia cepacia]
MDSYGAIEKELTHVKNAIQILHEKQEEFPRGAVIGDPAYWCARVQSIRRRAERYNHQKLQEQADELLLEISKLRR